MYFVPGLQRFRPFNGDIHKFLETLISAGVKFLDASKAAEACGAMLEIRRKAKNANKNAALKTWPQCIVSHSLTRDLSCCKVMIFLWTTFNGLFILQFLGS